MGRVKRLILSLLNLPALPSPFVIRYRVITKYLGGVFVALGMEFLLVGVVSLGFREGAQFYISYGLLALVSVALGSLLYRRVPEREINVPEGAALASLSFILASLAGAIPFAYLAGMPPLDSWFESMSGFTTTGFSLIDVEAAPGSILFMRAFSQWLGGLGFAVISVSLLLITGRSAVLLLGFDEKLFPRIARHVHVVIGAYVALTILGVAVLLVSGLGPFDAACYTLSGISTGGFAVHKKSMADLPYRVISLPVMFVMAAGAVNFVLYYKCWKTSPNLRRAVLSYALSPQVVALFAFFVLTGLLSSMALEGPDRFVHGFFMAVSAQTTTGYSTIEPSVLPGRVLTILILSMFIGGSIGSTAGGIKLFRFLEFTRGVNWFVVSRYYPREVVMPTKGVAREELPGIIYVISIYVFFIFTGACVFIWYGYDPLMSVFEVTSAASTVGLSTGIVSPDLAGGLKLLLVFLMWAGRLEFLPILVWSYSLVVPRREK